MAKDNNLLSKGSYDHYQTGAFIGVKNYIFSEQDGKKCLLLQLFNSSEKKISAFKFTLVQLDAAGRHIHKHSYTYHSLNIDAGLDYALKMGIVVKAECVSFRVQMLYAVSDGYKYVFKNGTAVKHYDPRGYENDKRSSRAGKGSSSVLRRYGNGGRLHGIAALIALLVICAACVYTALMGQDNFGKRRPVNSASADGDEYCAATLDTDQFI